VVPNSSDLNPLNYQVWGNATVLLQAATEAKAVPKNTDAFYRIWSALPEKAFDNAVKDYRKLPQACVCLSTVEISKT